MAKLHGKDALIYNGAQKMASMRDLKVSVTNKFADATDHDSLGWDDFSVAGNKNWTATSDHVKVLGDASQDALYDALVAGTQLTVNIYPQGIASGKPQYAGPAVIEKWDYNGPNNDIQSIQASIKGVGALVRSLQP